MKKALVCLSVLAGSFVLAQALMAGAYALLARPFDGLLTAEIAYNLAEGALTVALAQMLLLVAFGRSLAATATRLVAALFVMTYAAVGAAALVEGVIQDDWIIMLPTVALAVPWVLAALIADRRMVFDLWPVHRPAA